MYRAIIFHDINGHTDETKYQNLPIESFRYEIDYRNQSFDDIRNKFVECADSLIRHKIEPIFIGHGIGAWWARYLAKEYGLKAILLNPIIRINGLTKPYIEFDTSEYEKHEYTIQDFPYAEIYAYFELPIHLISGDEIFFKLLKKEADVIITDGEYDIIHVENVSILINKAMNNITI